LESTIDTTKFCWARTLLIVLPVVQALNIALIADEMSRKAISDLLQALAAVIAALAAFFASKKLRCEGSTSSTGWTLISIAACLFATGMIAFMYVEVVLKVPPYPSFAEAFFILFYLPMIAGILRLPIEKIQQREIWNIILDVSALAIVASMFIWHFNLRILLQSLASAPTLGVRISLIYTFLDSGLLLLLFYRLVRRLGHGKQFVPMLLLVMGSFGLITSDLLQGYVATLSNFTSGSPIDMGWVLFSTFLGIAALYILEHGDSDAAANSGNTVKFDLFRSVWTVSLTYLWIAMALIMLVWAVFNHEKVNLWVLVAGLLGATLLAVTRQVRSLRENAGLYNALQQAHTDLEETVRERTSELEASESKLKSILVSTPVGISILNSGRTILSMNFRALEMLGYEKYELIGKTTRILYDNPQDFDQIGKQLYTCSIRITRLFRLK
jgi:PAS domain-containing protein